MMPGKFFMQSRIDASGGEERFVRASLDNTALMQDENKRGLTDGGEPVCDYKSRPAFQQNIKRRLNKGLAFWIHRAGGFIQN